MMPLTTEASAHPRVVALVSRFQAIAAQMRELPIYNDAVAVAAHGFCRFGENELIGVLLTPWFMNVILLPCRLSPLNMAEIGKRQNIDLPTGPRTFVGGGDQVIGRYPAHSLHSSVLEFSLPGQAEAEANRAFAAPLQAPTAPQASGADGRARTGAIDRRVLFGGRRGTVRPAAGRSAG